MLNGGKTGTIRGIMDLGLNNTIVHHHVKTNITIDRGVMMSVTPDIVDLGIMPTVHGLTEPLSFKIIGTKINRIREYFN